ncbi:MAG: hypothetical protein M1294_08310, partial [Firmicutes bacterium]|nr:hypothetical protein [Bacillota bacterium]MCL5013401.1 hypothetical protein [Bacillota bacterium]
GDQHKPSGANGLGAAIKEPGSCGGDPETPTSTPSGLGGGRVHLPVMLSNRPAVTHFSLEVTSHARHDKLH